MSGVSRRRLALWCGALAAGVQGCATTTDADAAHAALLRTRGLSDALAYALVESLVTEVGARPAGSPNDARAVAWALAQFERLGFANVRAEPVALRVWQRGPAQARLTAPVEHPLVILALGNSVATLPGGIEADVAYYADFESLRNEAVDAGRARGRIVFIDQKAERTRDGSSYGRAVLARVAGAVEAARRGALAVAIRSIGTDQDRIAHTGAMLYDAQVARIPALAVSIPDADVIARLHARGHTLRMHLSLQSQAAVDAMSHNVIAEVPGLDLAHEIVLIGAHLDSWDVGQGALDDGAGVGIVIAAAKLLLGAGRRARRTVRVVLFANEENGFDGAIAYGERYRQVVHQLVGESDQGAGAIWRMRTRVRDEALEAAPAIAAALEPLGIAHAGNAASPAPDAGVLMHRQGWPVVELTQDASHYFDVHHTENDTLAKVDATTLRQNVAAWAVVAWLAAQSPVTFGPLRR